ncbi:hypothetical protein QUF55_01660 [Clostridiaceae bacterium HSG29]|nr:hypothetical protein [Clostridiaceae bacterium HSG29]
MKVIAKPIEMIAWFNEDGKIKPIRFRLETENGEKEVIKVLKVFSTEKEKIAGNIMFSFKCKSIIQNIEKIYELKYEINSSKWMLFKI